jgi:hypothetical protein
MEKGKNIQGKRTIHLKTGASSAIRQLLINEAYE